MNVNTNVIFSIHTACTCHADTQFSLVLVLRCSLIPGLSKDIQYHV